MKDIFPKAVAPPKLVKKYAPTLGYIAAGISAMFAVLHMFRIDTFVPIIDNVIPASTGWAGTIVVLIVLAEVFALPFLLRTKLSTLAQIVSGYFAVLAPLLWLLITLWAYDTSYSTGQLGQFVHVPGSGMSILVNVVWLTFVFYTLWALGYNNIKLSKLLPPAKKKV